MGKDFDARYPRFAIQHGDQVTIDGTAFCYVDQVADGWILRPANGVGPFQTFTFSALNALNAAGEVLHEKGHFLDASLRTQPRRSDFSIGTLSPKQRARLINRDAFVQGFKELYNAGIVLKTESSVAEHMEAICTAATPYLAEIVDLVALDRDAEAKLGVGRRSMGGRIVARLSPVHPRTLLKWARAEAAEGKAGLADRIAERGDRLTRRLGLEEEAFLVARVHARWLDRNRPTQSMVIEDVQGDFHVLNATRLDTGLEPLTIPGRQAIRRCIRSIDPLLGDIARLGRDEAIKRHRLVGRGLEFLRPFERVEMDEQKIDLISQLTSVGLLPLFTKKELELLGLTDKKGRWWICMAMDCRTRVIVGLILTKDPKSSAAARCLRMAVSDKSWLSEVTGAAVPWDQYAGIELLSTDNGAAFKGTDFTHRCSDLGIQIERTIAGVPSMRGHIERAFQTLGQGLLPRLAGRTFGDVLERGDHPSEARACLGPEDLCFALVRWIVDIYHNTPHSGLDGRTPLEQWEADHRDGNWPLRAAPDRRQKRLAFGLHLSRKVGREGVTVLGLRYHSHALAEHVLRKGNTIVDVRWDEEDIGAIDVRISTDEWIPVSTVHPGYEGLNARAWIAARRALQTRDPRRKGWERDVVRKAIDDIAAMNAHRMLQFGLIERSITQEELKGIEEGLFDGFRVGPTRPKTLTCDGPGRSVVPVAPDAEPDSVLSPVEGRLPATASSEPEDAGSSDLHAPPRLDDGEWIIEA